MNFFTDVLERLRSLVFGQREERELEIETAGRDHEVIGVVSDVSRDAEGDMAPTLYHAHTQLAGDETGSVHRHY